MMFISETYKDVQPEREEMQKNIRRMIAFNSARKYSAAVVEQSGENNVAVYVKGASEVILERSTTIYNASGELKELSDTDKSSILNDSIIPMAKNGLRTICLALKNIDRCI